MGLARADRDAVGRAGLCAGRRALVLGEVPGGDQRGRDLRAPGRGDRRRAAPPGRHQPRVADRPDGDRRLPGHRPDHRRSSPQVAKHYGVEVWVCPPAARSARASSSPRSTTSPARGGAPRRVDARSGRRRPISTAGPSSVSDQRKRHGSTIAELAAQEHLLALPGHRVPGAAGGAAGRLAHRAGRVRGQPLQRPARPGRPDRDRHGPPRASCTWRSSRPPDGGSRVTAAPRPAPARSLQTPSTHGCSSGRCWTRSRPRSPADAKPNRPPGEAARSPRPPGCAASQRRRRRRPRRVRADREGRRG